MSKALESSIINSALWAAYGDALGFITELADERTLKRRTNQTRVPRTIAWTRRIGGRFGPTIELPAGSYSDDTQLRLATSRAIRGNATFDVEAFAKVELPVWTCYSLGAGRASKLAAAELANPNIRWFSNFFSRKGVEYLRAGGNGAAMRVQPHVWVARDKRKPEEYLPDVVKNAICSHGHPRGILGAVFHAVCLGHCLSARSLPDPAMLADLVETLRLAAKCIKEDSELSAFWLPVWEKQSGLGLDSAIDTVAGECLEDLKAASPHLGKAPDAAYRSALQAIGATAADARGSGTKTAILAALLCWLHRDSDPEVPLVCAANTLGTDTDTIGTMAGALLGAVLETRPSEPLQDQAYIEREAKRLADLGKVVGESFSYPDLMQWNPPAVQLDAIGIVEGRLCVSGLAFAKAIGSEYKTKSDSHETVWQWLSLDFGQSVIAKRRPSPKQLPTSSHPRPPRTRPSSVVDRGKPRQLPLSTPSTKGVEMTLDTLTKEAIQSGFDPTIIGRHIVSLSCGPDGIERAVAYASIVAKAKMARDKR